MKRQSLVGNRYGKLVVKEMLYGIILKNAKQPKTYCVCNCDCGKEVVANAYEVKSGRKQSCGCDSSELRSLAHRKDHTGKQYGRLTVVKTLYGSRCRCRCECGSEVTASTADLISGHTQSCGCLQKERTSESSIKDYTGMISKYGVKLLKQYSRNNKSQWLWECECGICGNVFVALPAKVLNGHTTSCGCRKRSSRELLIENILKREGVHYVTQYKIDACRDKQVLFFDFAIFKDNQLFALIEYDGRQHFRSIELYGGEEGFLHTVRRDKIKNNYCDENKIHLYRLPYAMSDDEIENKIIDIIYP